MSNRTTTFGLTLLLGLSVVAAAPAQTPNRRQAFRALYGMTVDTDALVARLETEQEAALAIEDGAESLAFLQASASAVLAEFPDMPAGFRALLTGALVGSQGLENPWNGRAVLLHSYTNLTWNPEAYAVAGPVVFPRVLRAAMRRGHLPVLDHVAKLHVLARGLEDLAGQLDLLPAPLHGVALGALVEGTGGDAAHPAACQLVLARGASELYPEEDVPVDGRQVFLNSALGALHPFTPAVLARSVLTRFAAAGAVSEQLPGADRAAFAAVLEQLPSIGADAVARERLEQVFQGLLGR